MEPGFKEDFKNNHIYREFQFFFFKTLLLLLHTQTRDTQIHKQDSHTPCRRRHKLVRLGLEHVNLWTSGQPPAELLLPQMSQN